MKKLTFGRKYKPKTMEKRGIVHIDDIMEYLDSLKSWTTEEIRCKCVEILLYIHGKFDISKPEALISLRKWIQENNIDLRVSDEDNM